MEDPIVVAQHAAMEALGWGPRDLYLATLAYGRVEEGHVHDHFGTGGELGEGETAVVIATLRDELMERGIPSPFGPA